MIYSHKPQRSGKSIITNTNHPPQDPPPPSIPLKVGEAFIPIEDTTPPVPESHIIEEQIVEEQIPDILIDNTIPPVMDVCPKCDSIPPSLKPKLSIFTRIKRFFWRR